MKTGDFITFGRYPTGANGELSSVVWQVLVKKEGKLLLISRDCLDFQPFHGYSAVTWKDSDLRVVLNEVFYYEAFWEDERERICRMPIATDKELTFDCLFLPSVLEIKRYLKSDAARRAVPTDYARKRGRWQPKNCGYWLRDRGFGPAYAADVLPSGEVDPDGDEVYEITGIRPCMWIKSEAFE